jgi:hypothetical protein
MMIRTFAIIYPQLSSKGGSRRCTPCGRAKQGLQQHPVARNTRSVTSCLELPDHFQCQQSLETGNLFHFSFDGLFKA